MNTHRLPRDRRLSLELLEGRVVPASPGPFASEIGPFIPGQPVAPHGPIGPNTLILHGGRFAAPSTFQGSMNFHPSTAMHVHASPFRAVALRERFGAFRTAFATNATAFLGQNGAVLHSGWSLQSPATTTSGGVNTSASASTSGTITFNPAFAFVNHFA